MYGAIEYRPYEHPHFQEAKPNPAALFPILQATAVGYALVTAYTVGMASFEAGSLDVQTPTLSDVKSAAPAVGLYLIGVYLGYRAGQAG